MRERCMENLQGDTYERTLNAARRAVHLYAQGIVQEEELVEQISAEWERRQIDDEVPPFAVLMRIAQRICSTALYWAWRSTNIVRRENAFANLKRYLEVSLRQTRYIQALQAHVYTEEDVVNQTLEELHRMLLREDEIELRDPAAFLKWAQTILIRQAHTYSRRVQRTVSVSLDTLVELFGEIDVKYENNDPLEYVLWQEVQQVLSQAITSLKNKKYQQVLLYIFYAELEEKEVADRLGVTVNDIYVWKSRALKLLRKDSRVIHILRSLSLSN